MSGLEAAAAVIFFEGVLASGPWLESYLLL
jgi:hypothetical protein